MRLMILFDFILINLISTKSLSCSCLIYSINDILYVNYIFYKNIINNKINLSFRS